MLIHSLRLGRRRRRTKIRCTTLSLRLQSFSYMGLAQARPSYTDSVIHVVVLSIHLAC